MEHKNTLSPSRRAYEVTMRTLLYGSAFLTCALLLFIIGYICVKGLPGISWQFLTTEESVLNDTVGILPAIYNTLFVIFVSLIIVLPLGVGAAIYLTEYAKNRRLVTAIEFATETLSGIPSILPVQTSPRNKAYRPMMMNTASSEKNTADLSRKNSLRLRFAMPIIPAAPFP